ncbi:hypothetical protein R3X26_02970 [Vibrio sp. TH_r3]|uniref:hypothetical protein n=1 Tax=Vibrio sp. TH_r3 TaxID=3082084 RepID=UPI00295367EC|nr:hypothetical protein [Vibrio sp. TH_r3]MDV7103362.1 hypothetical protein [Vibrio sp. TH_r3]
MKKNNQIQTIAVNDSNEKYSVLFFLEGITLLCFVFIVLSFTIPYSAIAMKMIVSSIIVGSCSSIAILAFANARIGVERGLFTKPVLKQQFNHQS